MIHMNAFEHALSYPYVHETNVVRLFHVVFDEASDSRAELGPVMAVWGGLEQLYHGHRFTLAEEKRKRGEIFTNRQGFLWSTCLRLPMTV
jgi:hypothetical protein